VARLHGLAESILPTDAQLIELARLELARVATLGIAGFDTPRTHDAMRESAEALDGIRELLVDAGVSRWAAQAPQLAAVDTTWRRASENLRSATSFDEFDRLTYIAAYEEPAAKALDRLRIATGTKPVQMLRAWRYDVPSVYDAGAFDTHAYSPAIAPSPT